MMNIREASWRSASEGAISFLADNHRAIMITLRKDGSPTGHPMSPFFGVNGLYLNTYGRSPKANNLKRDPRVSCLVTSFASPAEREEVLVRGVARFVPNEEQERYENEDGRRRARMTSYFAETDAQPDEPLSDEDRAEGERRRARAAERVVEGKRVIFEVIPAEVRGPVPPLSVAQDRPGR